MEGLTEKKRESQAKAVHMSRGHTGFLTVAVSL